MRFSARVTSGRGEGRKLNFPTLNLEIPPGFSADQGIYAGWVWLEGLRMPAAFHYGPVPMFGITAVGLEAHVIDQELREAPAKLEFELLSRLREVRSFESREALASQIAADVAAARAQLEKL